MARYTNWMECELHERIDMCRELFCEVFRVREYAISNKKVPAVGGIPVMKSDKILPMCEEATENLFNELQSKLAKIIKKSANF